MLCLPYAFWSVCLLRCYFGSQTWNHPNSAHPVFLCFLSVWTWALGSDLAFNCDSSLSYSEVPSPPAQCFSSWRNLGPIYKWFVQNSVLLHKQFLCSCGTSASRSSRNPLPLQGAKPVGQGGHTSLTSEGGRTAGPFSGTSPSECPLQSDWYWLSVFWALRSPVGSGPNPSANE